MKYILLFLLTVFSAYWIHAQKNAKINWVSFEDAVKKNEKTPKKFIIDVYTDWCGWCKKMDKTTFRNPTIVEYINEYFYAIKLNAERTDTVILGEQIFVNQNPNQRRSAHELAIALLNGKMSYPSIVYLDENVEMLQAVPGFYDAESIEPILHFFGEDIYLSKSWEDYKTAFSSQLKN